MANVTIKTAIPGPRSQQIVAAEQRHLAPGLQGFALWAGIAMHHGQGSYLTDVDGNTYIDLIGGIGVNSLGHCHPRYVEALKRQVEKLTVGSFTSEPRSELVNEITSMAPAGLDRLQLYSGGAEAVESALRLSRCYTKRSEVVGFWGGFHGKTAGAMAVTGSAIRYGLGPLPIGTSLVPYADCYRCPIGLTYPGCSMACVEFIRKAIKAQPAGPIAAMIAEPMQGTAGNIIPPKEFLPSVAEAVHDAGALFIADEMITGLGRTGKLWAVEHTGTKPDIITVGKGFGSGFPVSGVLTRTEIAETKPWSNPSGASSSYGGNPLAATAALTAVRTICENRLWENSARIGAMMLQELKTMQERYPFIGDVRGVGLLIGIELVKDRTTKEPLDSVITRQLYTDCLKRGLLAMVYTPHIRLQPALTIDEQAAREGLGILDEVFHDMHIKGQWRTLN
jgi:4-aminobutyrate aminotransferase/(S)-3-amino-2-methylpropionate transaminase